MASTTSDNKDKSPAEIEADIRETRARISEEVDALGDKVSPDNIADNTKEAIHSAQEAVVSTVHDLTSSVTSSTDGLASSVVDMVKRNPLPAALIGLGIGLLAAGGASAGRSSNSDSYDKNKQTGNQNRSWAGPSVPVRNDYGAGHYGSSHSANRRYADGLNSDGLSADTDYTPGTAQLPEPGDSSYSSNPLSSVAESAGGFANDAGNYAQEYAQSAKSGLARLLEERPLVVGGLAVIAALALGLALPTTRQEDELMGATSDELLNTAKAKAQDTFEVAKTTAQETAETVKSEVQSKLGSSKEEAKSTLKAEAKEAKHGVKDKLGDAKDAAKDVAEKAKATAKETAQKEADKRNLSSSGKSSKSNDKSNSKASA